MILVTGSLGLVGIETCLYFLKKNITVIGIDNNMRKYFFGESGDNFDKLKILKNYSHYYHYDYNLLDYDKIKLLIKNNISNIECIIHTAAQPSHDWAQKEPMLDFNINATVTLNLLENIRQYNKDCVFIYVSTNKVYGDSVNNYDFIETETRYDLDTKHYNYEGIDEYMSVDNSMHSLFGVSKLSADLITQEYGRYFNMKTVCFRCGCITGENHSGTIDHGFLSFLIRNYKNNQIYKINGYNGKQVRDNLHASDLANAFYLFYKNPKNGANIYNIGGGRENSISILEIKNILNLKTEYDDEQRRGDHKWWITNNNKFKKDYSWQIKYNLKNILKSFNI